MKKLILLFTVMAFGFALNAQQIEYQSASKYFSLGELGKAKESIDKCVAHESTKEYAKAWLLKSKVYYTIHVLKNQMGMLKKGMSKKAVKQIFGEPEFVRNAKNPNGVKMERWSYSYGIYVFFDDNEKLDSWTEPNDGALKAMNDDFLGKGYDALQNATKYDTEKEIKRQINVELYGYGNEFYNRAVEFYNGKMFVKAASHFEKAASLRASFGITDTASFYYAGISYYSAEDLDNAKKLFLKLAKMKYNKANVYISLSEIYKQGGDTTKALEALNMGKEAMPENYNLLIAETNIFLAQGRTEDAKNNLLKVIEMDPENANLHYVVGTQYFDMLQGMKYEDDPKKFEAIFETAKKYLTSAIELKSDYFDAYYNLGALYYNEGVRHFNEAQDIDPNDFEAYDAKKKIFMGLWEQALKYMEKAHELNDKDFDTLSTLKELYARMRMNDKLKEVNEKLKAIKK